MNVVNIGGNAVLIYGFGMGVMGAALASLVSRAIACAVVLYLLQKPGCALRVDSLRAMAPNGGLIRRILRVGIPAGLLVLAAGALLLQGYQIMVLAANSVGGGALAMYGCYCAALIVPAGVSCWAFPLLSRFQMGLGHLLVTSFQVTLRHLPQTLLLILLLFVTVWATAGFFPLAVFTPALNALLASMPAERVIRRYLPEKEPEGEEL